MSESAMDLYNQMFMDHGRNCRNFFAMPDADASAEGYNPSCGDRLTLFAKGRNGRMEKLSFQGEGCVLCLASASILTESMMGHDDKDFFRCFEDLKKVLAGGSASDCHAEALAPFKILTTYPTRQKCVYLAWETLAKVLQEGEASKKLKEKVENS